MKTKKLAGLALSVLLPVFLRLPCWNRINRLVDCLIVVSEGGRIR